MILTHYILDIIFPPVCFACGEHLKRGEEKFRCLCVACSRKLDFMPGFLCPTCFRRLPTGEGVCHRENRFVLAAPLSYSNPVARELIHILKYKGLKTAAEPLTSTLADYLASSIRNSPPEADPPSAEKLEIQNFILVPIPLHPKRERRRGFNQALVLAELLKEKSELLRDVPIATGALIRTKPTLSQTGRKDREAREENVRDGFEVRRPELISGKDIFLLDDVFTSGATIREAARTLRIAGAKKIIALATARA